MFIKKNLSRLSFNALVTLVAVLMSTATLFAQSINVTGTVTDKAGEPLIGAYVSVKGTNNGSITDIDGKYSLSNVPTAAVLAANCMGFKDIEVPVNGKAVVNIVMQEDAVLLEDVVVVGYGTQRKENLTGAVASVNVSQDLQGRPIADVGRGLQGTTPGLTVTIPSGEVGSDPVMKIRGQIGSINGGSSPLILVDNVEVPSIQMINPDDIESMSILKDAASASIYGSKGAFGVILITTKKGAKTESVSVSYSGNVSFQNLSKKFDMGGVDALEYSLLAAERVGSNVVGAFWKVNRESLEKSREWQNTYGGIIGKNDPMVYGRDWYYDPSTKYKYGLRTYDPYEYMVREWAPSQQHNLSLNGKSGRVNYNVGLGYLDQNGMQKPAKKDNFERYNASVRVSSDVTEWLQLRAGIMYSKRQKNYPYATSSATADPWLYLYRWGPTYPLGYTEEGAPLRSGVSEVAQANTASKTFNFTNINAGLTVTPLENWTVDFDYNYTSLDDIDFRPGTRFTAANSWGTPSLATNADGSQKYVDNAGNVVSAGTAGAMPAYMIDSYEYTAFGSNPDHIYRKAVNGRRNTINVKTDYNWQINENNNLKVMVGLSSVKFTSEENWSQRNGLLNITNPQFNFATGNQTSGGDKFWDSQVGVFGRLNYNYKEKYLLEANIRYDGTSKFPSHLQWRWFPSFSAGWRVTEESWMSWSKTFLSSLKLRGSWGMIGDQSVKNSLYIPTMDGKQNNWIIGGDKLYYVGTPQAVASDITWQDIKTLDLGFDARLFKSKFGVSFDWYRRDTDNMIVPMSGISPVFGSAAPNINAGALRTNGFEVMLDFNHRFKNGLGINVTATFADSKTKVTKYGNAKSIYGWYVGKTYGEIWGYETDRLYQASDFLYNADGSFQTITVDPLTGKESAKGTKVNKLAGTNPVYQAKLQNSAFIFGPGDVKYKDLNGDGAITDGAKLVDDHGDLTKIGNSTPRYEYSFRIGADWKGFDFSIFFQGVGKREMWGKGFLAIPGFSSADGAMPETFASDFWKEDRTNAFYPRPYNYGASDPTIGNLVPQSKYLLDMSYLRIKNITLGYTLPEVLSRKAFIQNVRIYVALENFFTFDNLNGLPIDPEEIGGVSIFANNAAGDNYNMGRTGVGAPTFKSASVGLQLTF